LWSTLSQNVPPSHWRAALSKNGWISSSHTFHGKTDAIVYKQIISTAFSAVVASTPTEAVNEPDGRGNRFFHFFSLFLEKIPQYTLEALKGLKNDDLRAICQRHALKQGKKKNWKKKTEQP